MTEGFDLFKIESLIFLANHTSLGETNVCAFLIHRSARSFKKGNENESLFKKSENIRSRCSLQKERKEQFALFYPKRAIGMKH